MLELHCAKLPSLASIIYYQVSKLLALAQTKNWNCKWIWQTCWNSGKPLNSRLQFTKIQTSMCWEISKTFRSEAMFEIKMKWHKKHGVCADWMIFSPCILALGVDRRSYYQDAGNAWLSFCKAMWTWSPKLVREATPSISHLRWMAKSSNELALPPANIVFKGHFGWDAQRRTPLFQSQRNLLQIYSGQKYSRRQIKT